MTKIFYDTEFHEDGRTIDLISIGMVNEHGRELYLINSDVDLDALARHEWLATNVIPHLPLRRAPRTVAVDADVPGSMWHPLEWDEDHQDYVRVKPRKEIADSVRRFVLLEGKPELWAWYGAYDHVGLAQLFGPMVQLPAGIPMWTNDLRQEVERLGNPRLPRQQHAEHHALADAHWVKLAHAYLAER